MWSARGYREAVLSQKITGSMSATKLQEGEVIHLNTQVSILLNQSDLDEIEVGREDNTSSEYYRIDRGIRNG